MLHSLYIYIQYIYIYNYIYMMHVGFARSLLLVDGFKHEVSKLSFIPGLRPTYIVIHTCVHTYIHKYN